MQAVVDFLVGGSNPSAADTAAAPQPASTDQDSNRRPKKFCGRVRYHSTGDPCDTTVSPIAWSLLSENF